MQSRSIRLDPLKGEYSVSVSLYRRYRPRSFDEVAGQETVVEVLKKALQRDQVAHAWLFSGPRGCGKTSAARLLAKALNCTQLKDGYEPCGECLQCVSIGAGDSLDVVEIDGASNNGVEEIRELKTHVSLSPFSAKWKVYIIDEVHMLSISAFNALLKTLEEPPPFVVFILATTEPHKVPVTIRSRCQHIPFHRIELRAICSRLEAVAEKEGVPADPRALREIARHADGALRDALSLMEQALSLGNGEVSMEAADRLLGGGTLSDLERWIASLKENNVQPFLFLEEMFQKGASPQRVVEGVFLLFRNLWAVKRWGRPVLEALSLAGSEMEFLCEEAASWKESQLSEMMLFCSKLIPQVRAGLRSDVLSGLLAAKGLECRSFAEGPRANVKEEAPALRPEPPVVSPARPAQRVEDVTEAGIRSARPFELPSKPVALPSKTEASSRLPAMIAEPSPEESVPFEGGPSEAGWRELEKRLFEKNLPLYCLLVGSSIAVEDNVLEIRFPEEAGYCFTVLSSERNCHILASEAKKLLGPQTELFLLWRGDRRPCSGNGGTKDDEDSPSWNEPASPPYLFKPPEDLQEKENERSLSGTAEGGEPPRSSGAAAAKEAGLPFEGLVNEVLKWSEGEVILVKREEHEEEPPPAGETEQI